MRLANLRLPCTRLSDGYFGVLAGTFPLCQQPHSLSLTRSPGICPISSDQSKSKNAAPVPVRSFRLNQVPSRCRFTAVGTAACRDSSSPTTEMDNACGRVFRHSTKRSGKLRWPRDKSQQAWRQATGLSARSHKSTTARNLIDPILDVQADWRWQKLKITLDPTGRITAAYGKQRQSHTFKKANKTGTCRHIEILATMAVHGAWQPSRTHSEADKKAFKCLQGELQAILPLPGDPFRKEGAQFHPLFELTLPKEHWRDTSKENELGSEED